MTKNKHKSTNMCHLMTLTGELSILNPSFEQANGFWPRLATCGSDPLARAEGARDQRGCEEALALKTDLDRGDPPDLAALIERFRPSVVVALPASPSRTRSPRTRKKQHERERQDRRCPFRADVGPTGLPGIKMIWAALPTTADKGLACGRFPGPLDEQEIVERNRTRGFQFKWQIWQLSLRDGSSTAANRRTHVGAGRASIVATPGVSGPRSRGHAGSAGFLDDRKGPFGTRALIPTAGGAEATPNNS